MNNQQAVKTAPTQFHIDVETKTSIADIPTNLTLEANTHRTTIETAKRIGILKKFRIDVEAEAETTIDTIDTTLGLALADVAETLGIKYPDDSEQLRHILGPATYLAVYVNPIPYQPTPQERAEQEPRAATSLLAKLRERQGQRPRRSRHPS